MPLPFLDLKAATAELRTELDAAHRRVADSGWFLLGRELEAFEAEYAASVGTAHCIGVANGLEALQLVLLARGIGESSEIFRRIKTDTRGVAKGAASATVGAGTVGLRGVFEDE